MFVMGSDVQCTLLIKHTPKVVLVMGSDIQCTLLIKHTPKVVLVMGSDVQCTLLIKCMVFSIVGFISTLLRPIEGLIIGLLYLLGFF